MAACLGKRNKIYWYACQFPTLADHRVSHQRPGNITGDLLQSDLRGAARDQEEHVENLLVMDSGVLSIGDGAEMPTAVSDMSVPGGGAGKKDLHSLGLDEILRVFLFGFEDGDSGHRPDDLKWGG